MLGHEAHRVPIDCDVARYAFEMATEILHEHDDEPRIAVVTAPDWRWAVEIFNLPTFVAVLPDDSWIVYGDRHCVYSIGA